ncbi:MAG: pilin [Candidatus Woykebacteria bacterium]
MGRLKNLFTTATLFITVLLAPKTVLAQIGNKVSDDPGYTPLKDLEVVFANALNVISILAGFAVLLMIVIGAFRYMVAQGDPKAVTAARSQITWAIGGLFFIIAGWLVILFVSQFTGLNLTNFCVDLPTDDLTCSIQRP